MNTTLFITGALAVGIVLGLGLTELYWRKKGKT